MMGYYLSENNIITFTQEDNFDLNFYSVISIVLVMIGTIFYAMNSEKILTSEYSHIVKINDEIDETNVELLDFETEVNTTDDENINLLSRSSITYINI